MRDEIEVPQAPVLDIAPYPDCRGCGWKTGPFRKFYCRTCDPTGEREDRCEKAERSTTEGAT